MSRKLFIILTILFGLIYSSLNFKAINFAIGDTLMTPVAPLYTTMVFPDPDSNMWLGLANEAHAKGLLRIHHTQQDGLLGVEKDGVLTSVQGRPVHWASPLMWLLQLSGATYSKLAHIPFPQGLELSIPYLLAGVMLLFFILGTLLAGKVFGYPIGLLVGTCIFTGLRTWQQLTVVDHHFFINFCQFILFLAAFGVILRKGRSLAIISGLAAGFGIWISAINMVPSIICFAAMIVAQAWIAPNDARPKYWRYWGVSAALIAFLGYLIEYSPHFPPLHLETNNLFYTFTLLALGEALYQWCNYKQGREVPWANCALAGIGMAAPALALLMWGSRVSTFFDPFLARLLSIISECQPVQPNGIVSSFAPVVLGSIGTICFLYWLWQKDKKKEALSLAVVCTVFFVTAFLLLSSMNRWAALFELTPILIIALGINITKNQFKEITIALAAILILQTGMNAITVKQGITKIKSKGYGSALHKTKLLRLLATDIAKDAQATKTPIRLGVMPLDDSVYLGYLLGPESLTASRFYEEDNEQMQQQLAAFMSLEPSELEQYCKLHNLTYLILSTQPSPQLGFALYGTRGTTTAPIFNFLTITEKKHPKWLTFVKDYEGMELYKVNKEILENIKNDTLPSEQVPTKKLL